MPHWSLGRTFDFEGDRIAWDAFGSGPALVLVHGTPFSSYVWRRVAREASRRWRVHVFDLLGYGQSSMRDGQDVSLGVQNRVLAALVGHWGLARPTVVAHDFGGAAALRAHLLDGCDYERLLLVDPVAIRPWGSPFVRHVREHAAAFEGLPAHIHEALVARYLRGAIAREMPERELRPYVDLWRGPERQAAFYRQIAQMDERYTDEIEGKLAAMRCPVRILWGEADEWIPVTQGGRLRAMIPGSDLRTVPDAGHLMQEDAPEAIVAAIAELG
jgi:pimeloyl-ACP methyl ester carboxylesterase